MIKIRFYARLVLFIIPLFLAFNNCTDAEFMKSRDTVLGNPMTTFPGKLLSSVCSVVQRCHPEVSRTQCYRDVSQAPGFHEPLGIPSQFSSLSALAEAESDELFRSESTAAENCLKSIESQDCSEPQVQAAYRKTDPSPFSGTPRLVRGEICAPAVTSAVQYRCSSKIFLKGRENASLTLKSIPSDFNFLVSPALPAGLALDPRSGAITGKPISALPETTYLITARKGSREISTSLNLRVAEGFLVNDLGDSTDASPGNGTCETSAGTCSLRAALNELNATSPLPSTSQIIVLPPGTITLTSGELQLKAAAEIHGDCESKTTIDANAKSRTLHLSSSGFTRLKNLKLINGRVTSFAGAALLLDAPPADMHVSIEDSVIANNVNASPAASAFEGGAIMSWPNGSSHQALLSLKACTFENNLSVNSSGGAIYSDWATNLTISDSTFKGNQALHGGAVRSDAQVKIERSAFHDNVATSGWGGALWQPSGPSFQIVNSTFYRNRAVGGGALASSTSASGSGSGTVINSTFAENASTSAGYGGGSYGRHRFVNSILSSNFDATGKNNCGGIGVSEGFNLSDSPVSDCNFTATTDIPNEKPLLSPFQNNGGLVFTLGLLPGSPGLDQGSSGACPATDSRGLLRPRGLACDLGSFEVQ